MDVVHSRIALALVACAFLGNACESSTPSTGSAEPRIVVTRDDESLHEGCAVREVAEVVLSLGVAISEGNLEEIDLLFAMENDFQSLGVGPPGGRTGEDTNDRGTLNAYFESRIANHERLAISEIHVRNEVGGPPPGVVRIDLLASRTGDDLGSQPLEVRGWGELLCPSKRIYLLNLGSLSPSENVKKWCPDPPNGPEEMVVACSTARHQ